MKCQINKPECENSAWKVLLSLLQTTYPFRNPGLESLQIAKSFGKDNARDLGKKEWPQKHQILTTNLYYVLSIKTKRVGGGGDEQNHLFIIWMLILTWLFCFKELMHPFPEMVVVVVQLNDTNLSFNGSF